MIDRGKIAFDGDFNQLRNRFGDRRQLRLMTHETAAPPARCALSTTSGNGMRQRNAPAPRVLPLRDRSLTLTWAITRSPSSRSFLGNT